MDPLLVSHLISAFAFSVVGLIVFALGFFIFDKATPFSLWKEIIDEHNTALAILFGATVLGTSLIIAAAVG